MTKCPYCQEEVKQGWKFCPTCERPLPKCSQCGCVLADTGTSCPKCGIVNEMADSGQAIAGTDGINGINPQAILANRAPAGRDSMAGNIVDCPSCGTRHHDSEDYRCSLCGKEHVCPIEFNIETGCWEGFRWHKNF